MLRPSVNELTKNNESTYALVIATAKLARKISDDAEEKGELLNEKPVTTAIRDIYDGKVKVVNSGASNH